MERGESEWKVRMQRVIVKTMRRVTWQQGCTEWHRAGQSTITNIHPLRYKRQVWCRSPGGSINRKTFNNHRKNKPYFSCESLCPKNSYLSVSLFWSSTAKFSPQFQGRIAELNSCLKGNWIGKFASVALWVLMWGVLIVRVYTFYNFIQLYTRI